MWEKTTENLSEVPQKYLDWMTKPYKLGDALRDVCSHLTVAILEQRFNMPYEEEWLLVKTNETSPDKQPCYIREVFLEGDGVPFVFARVVIPPSVYAKYADNFKQLDTKLIGETMLYNNPKTLRSAFQYAAVPKNYPLGERIEQCLPASQHRMETYWARQSIFYLEGQYPILITEAFMQAIPVMGVKSSHQ